MINIFRRSPPSIENVSLPPPQEELIEPIPTQEELIETSQDIGDVVLGGVGIVDINEPLIPKPEELNPVEKLNAAIAERSERAIKDLEFEPTPEIMEAVNGFYTDHMTLQAAIEAVADRDYASPVFAQILESSEAQDWERRMGSESPFSDFSDGNYRAMGAPNAKVYALRIANEAKSAALLADSETPESRLRLLRLSGQAVDGLYTESSVGVSTLEESDIVSAGSLADKVIEAAGTNELFYGSPSNRTEFLTSKNVASRINSSQKQFWADTRQAGQLLFHGTTNVGGINVNGLMSRNEQLRTTGEMHNTTALNHDGDTMHSVVPHFSEFYGMGQYAFGERGATIALPLIKVIDQAPYARDAKYGVARLKKDSEAQIPTPTIDRPIDDSAAGRSDRAGEAGIDRVFFASSDENGEVDPGAYVVGMHDKNNKPATYIVDRTNHKPFANEEALIGLGEGYGFPERAFIEPEAGQDPKAMTSDQREAVAAVAIKKLQQEYFDAYNGRGVVVPLRRGVFAQTFENMDVYDTKGRPAPTKYNAYTQGTGKRV